MLRFTSFEIIKDVKVLFRSEKIEEDVMLGAYTHHLTNRIHLVEQIFAVDVSVSL